MSTPSSTGRATAWNGWAAPPSSDAAQTETAVPSSTSRPRASTPPAPQPIRTSGSSASTTPSNTASGAARCAPATNTTARSQPAPPSAAPASAPAATAATRGSTPDGSVPVVSPAPIRTLMGGTILRAVPGPAGGPRYSGSGRAAPGDRDLRPDRGRQDGRGRPGGRAPRRGHRLGRRPAGLPRPGDPHGRPGRRAPDPADRDPRRHRAVHRGRVRPRRPRRDRRGGRRRAQRRRGRRHRSVPAGRPGRPGSAPAARSRRARAGGRRRGPAGGGCRPRRPGGAGAGRRRGHRSARPSAGDPCAGAGRDGCGPAGRRRALDGADPPPDRAVRPDHGPRRSLRGHRRAGGRHGRRRRRGGGAGRGGRGCLAERPPGAGLRRAAARRRRGHAGAHPPLRQAPAHVDAQAPGRRGARRPRPHSRRRRRRGARQRGLMTFEKWNALGNDYVIVEAAALPFELTPGRIRRICAAHVGVGADGILLLSPPTERGFVAALRIFNPDGSEAELSGNGAREAILYLRHRGWTDSDTFSIQTAAGEIRPTITGPATCAVDMGRARVLHAGELEAGGRTWRYQALTIGNPQCVIFAGEEVETLDLQRVGPPIENHERFPDRTNVSFVHRLDRATLRARIFERGVGETLSSGTGASGAAVAHVLRGGDSPVTVELDGGELLVDVDEALHVDLTGWAIPVFRGELS